MISFNLKTFKCKVLRYYIVFILKFDSILQPVQPIIQMMFYSPLDGSQNGFWTTKKYMIWHIEIDNKFVLEKAVHEMDASFVHNWTNIMSWKSNLWIDF